jgi:hypothetical protein
LDFPFNHFDKSNETMHEVWTRYRHDGEVLHPIRIEMILVRK